MFEGSVDVINGAKGDPHSFDALEKVLDDQAYRLSFWRVASDEINYRRFFDINDLAAIRVENPEVFANVHRIPFELIQKSLVSGIRIDHPDGLFDPLRYFEDLQAQAPLPGAVSANEQLHRILILQDGPCTCSPTMLSRSRRRYKRPAGGVTSIATSSTHCPRSNIEHPAKVCPRAPSRRRGTALR